MDGLWTVLAGVKDLATLVLILCLGGLGWLHIQMIRENREDRKALMELLEKYNDTLNGIKNFLSAMSGNPFQ